MVKTVFQISQDECRKFPTVEEVQMTGLNLLANLGGYVVEEVEEVVNDAVEGGIEKEVEDVEQSPYHSMVMILYGKPKAYVFASEVVCLIRTIMKGSLLTVLVMSRFWLIHITLELWHRIHNSLRTKRQHHLQNLKIIGNHQRMIKYRICVHQKLKRFKIDVI